MFDDLIGLTYAQCISCFHLCRLACLRLGIDLPDWPDICIEQAEEEMRARLPLFDKVIGRPQPGDLVWVTNFDGPPHVGVIIGTNSMLQVTRSHRSHRMALDNIWIKTRIAGIYRYAA